jgi:regulator of protease activity HflC (stomatin/prohibitin superfamily)
MKTKSSFSVLIFFVILVIGIALAYTRYDVQDRTGAIWIGLIFFLVALIVSSAIKIADQWEKAVVLRLGRFNSLRGPGLFFIIPIIDTVAYWIDIRVITTSFTAEKTLTKDTVPVDVDAVLFWKVLDAKKAALEIAEYKGAINWASQTALRDVIGKTMLSEMLEGRDKMSDTLQKMSISLLHCRMQCLCRLRRKENVRPG